MASVFLNENGFVVFEKVADQQQVQTATGLFWDWAESLGRGVNRNDPATWQTEQWMASPTTGVIFGHGIGQSEYLWYCRSLPKIKAAFSQVWNDDRLLVSFDGSGVFRPPEVNPSWSTLGGWYHVDQNGNNKKGRHGVQGLLNLLPSGDHDGGLVVVPRSQLRFAEIFSDHLGASCKPRGDFVPFRPNNPLWGTILGAWDLRPHKICLDPGDFVMWDSRTIHCNTSATPGAGAGAPGGVPGLRRLVAYVCMTPAKMVTDGAVIKKRMQACHMGWTSTHWPHEFHDHLQSQDVPANFRPVKLTEEQQQLVTGGLTAFK